MSDFEEAIDRVVARAGARRTASSTRASARSSPCTRPATRWSRRSPQGADKVHKISIIPRGIAALGLHPAAADRRPLPDDAEGARGAGRRAASAAAPPRRSCSTRSRPARTTTSTAPPTSCARWCIEYGMGDDARPDDLPAPARPGVSRRPRRADARGARVQRGHRPGARHRGEALLDERLAHVEDSCSPRSAPLLDRVSKALLEKETLEAAEFEALVRSGAAPAATSPDRSRADLAATIRARAPASWLRGADQLDPEPALRALQLLAGGPVLRIVLDQRAVLGGGLAGGSELGAALVDASRRAAWRSHGVGRRQVLLRDLLRHGSILPRRGPSSTRSSASGVTVPGSSPVDSRLWTARPRRAALVPEPALAPARCRSTRPKVVGLETDPLADRDGGGARSSGPG